MAQHERIAVITRYETEEDMLEDLKNRYTERRLRFKRIKYSYLKVSLERKEILFIEKYNEE